VYQVGYTLPRFQQLVGSHLQRGGTSPLTALAALAAFGVVIVTHTFVQVRAVAAPNRKLRQALSPTPSCRFVQVVPSNRELRQAHAASARCTRNCQA
jgi:hypothetical protein